MDSKSYAFEFILFQKDLFLSFHSFYDQSYPVLFPGYNRGTLSVKDVNTQELRGKRITFICCGSQNLNRP